jgi:hypothetical protein
VALSAPLLTACAVSSSTTGSGSASSTTFSTSVSAQNTPYFIRGKHVTVDAAYLDRYACANGLPLVCQRTSRFLSSPADCQCP